jgi:hypothetical protein
MRALTVSQPWAWAIIHGGKTIENRTRLWSYRGPLAVHAGARWSDRGAWFEPLQHAYAAWLGFDQWTGPYGGHTAMPIDPKHDDRDRELIDFGAVIGVVDLTGSHWATPDCCDGNPWAERSYVEHDGVTRHDIAHLVLADPRPVDPPIDCRGRLGLWTLPPDIEQALDVKTL